MCDKKEKGIYSIHCIENNKYYIGQTIDSLENRWWSSKSSLKGGYYHLYDLQEDWNKYGENAFEFEIVHILKEDENINEGLSARQLSEMFSIPQSYIYQIIAYKKRINK